MPRIIPHQNSRVCNYPWQSQVICLSCHFSKFLSQYIFAEELSELKSVRLDLGRHEELIACVSVRQTYLWKTVAVQAVYLWWKMENQPLR